MTARKTPAKPEPAATTDLGDAVDVKVGETTTLTTLAAGVSAPAAEGATAPAAGSDNITAVGDPAVEDDITAETPIDELAADVDRRAALASLAAPAPDGVPVPTIEVTPTYYVSGKELDWSSDTEKGKTNATMVITGTMVTAGYRTAQQGDKVKASKELVDRFVRLGSAVKG